MAALPVHIRDLYLDFLAQLQYSGSAELNSHMSFTLALRLTYFRFLLHTVILPSLPNSIKLCLHYNHMGQTSKSDMETGF